FFFFIFVFFFFLGLGEKKFFFLFLFAGARRLNFLSFVYAAVNGATRRCGGVFWGGVCLFLGLLPLWVAWGGGPQPARFGGTTVFSGMLVATVVGILFIPA
ncbi:efflux RND transporter permease subunit, partial [Enterobacter asburiae]